MTTVILKRQKARTFYRRHPWVLDSAIDRVDGPVVDGQVVDVVSDRGRFIARGVFNGHSHIRVRLYTWDQQEPIDEHLLRRRLERAIVLRDRLGHRDPQGAERLVFSEADGLSGLVVDRYGRYLVLQVTSLAMALQVNVLAAALAELLQPAGIVLRTDAAAVEMEGLHLTEGPCWGDPPPDVVEIVEHGVRYQVDLAGGQKTGFYLDQRDNRLAAARYLAGRRVLDAFCYTGGFALTAAMQGKADRVWAFDSSDRAIALARTNAAINRVENVEFHRGDAFDTLEHLVQQGERFSAVVLDPPKFAGGRRSVPQAMRAYHWLNRLAVQLLEPDGILVTCSCSGRVSREQFQDVLVGVAEKTRREICILEQRGAAPDHPVHVGCPETQYLKCFVCRVL